MSNTSQQTILNAFDNAAGTHATGGTAATLAGNQLSPAEQSLTDALTQTTQVINAQTAATFANTDAVAQETQTKSSSTGSSIASDAVSTASQVLGGGLSLLPLVSIFTSLFGGGQQQPAPLVPYSLPPVLNLQTTTSDRDVTYGENGLPKAANPPTSNQPTNQQTNSQPASIRFSGIHLTRTEVTSIRSRRVRITPAMAVYPRR